MSGHVAPKKGMSVLGIVLIVFGIGAVAVVGLLVVLSVFGTRKYIANAKRAEAMNSLGIMAKDAVAAYENAAEDGKPPRLCPSASKPVPADKAEVSGKKYMSSASDWAVDKDRNAGFACLKYEMSTPQYFQYVYEADSQGFTIRAHGDLNGNGVYSTYEIRGRVTGGRVRVDPTITETNPDE